jgi:hypothetical protein
MVYTIIYGTKDTKKHELKQFLFVKFVPFVSEFFLAFPG